MIASLFRGASFFARGLGIMWKPGVRAWAFIPLILSFVVFGLFSWWAVKFLQPWLDQVTDWSRDFIGIDLFGPILWIVVAAASLLIMAYSFVLVASLVACPFNALLAEAVEIRQTGRKTQGPGLGTVIKRSPIILIQESKKLLYFVLWALPVGVICLITLFFLPPLAILIWTLFSAWMLALEFSDYPMDNAGLNFRAMRQVLKRRRMLVLGFGLATFFFATVPILNLVTVPAAVCGATLMWLEALEQESRTRSA